MKEGYYNTTTKVYRPVGLEVLRLQCCWGLRGFIVLKAKGTRMVLRLSRTQGPRTPYGLEDSRPWGIQAWNTHSLQLFCTQCFNPKQLKKYIEWVHVLGEQYPSTLCTPGHSVPICTCTSWLFPPQTPADGGFVVERARRYHIKINFFLKQLYLTYFLNGLLW